MRKVAIGRFRIKNDACPVFSENAVDCKVGVMTFSRLRKGAVKNDLIAIGGFIFFKKELRRLFRSHRV